METYLDILMNVVIRLSSKVEWDYPSKSVSYSYTLSVIFLIFLIVFPLILMVFACRNSSRIKEDSYKNRCGALFEGFSLYKKVYPKSILFHPVLFFGRRIVVVLTAVKLRGFLWA